MPKRPKIGNFDGEIIRQYRNAEYLSDYGDGDEPNMIIYDIPVEV